MLKLSKLADYATVLMTAMAAAPGQLRNGHELAEQTGIPAPTVAKLLKSLARGGLLESLRGAHGGYRLTRDAAAISVADVIRALEGPIAVTECSQHGSGCDMESTCSTRSNWQLINQAIRQALESVSLAQMARPANRRSETPIHFIAASHAARAV